MVRPAGRELAAVLQVVGHGEQRVVLGVRVALLPGARCFLCGGGAFQSSPLRRVLLEELGARDAIVRLELSKRSHGFLQIGAWVVCGVR